MDLEKAGRVFILQFDPLFTIAIASLALLLGVYLRKKSWILEHYCLPIGLIGGVFVLVARILLYFFLNTEIDFDISMLPYFFLAFFATIGLNASIALIKHGGMVLFYFTIACWVVTIMQNILGVGFAYLWGLHPSLGVIAGAASLSGGHGSAIAFGSMIESHGISGAEAIGVATATFGVLAGSSLGPPVGKFLISRNRLKIETTHDPVYSKHFESEAKSGKIDPTNFLKMLTIVLICMAVGAWIGELFNKLIEYSGIMPLKNFKFPDYVWTMLLAAIIRNGGDAANIFKSCNDSLGLILSLSLRYAVVFVVMSLSMRYLRAVLLPLTIILLIQTILVALIAIFWLFPLLGKDYDAAVMCAGFCGLLLGAPHSAMSNISTVCEQHDKVYSHKAFVIVSLCGAALLDLFMMPFSSVCISMLL